MNLIKILYLIIILSSLFSCDSSEKYSNRVSDKYMAQEVTQKLYKYIIDNDIDSIFLLNHKIAVNKVGYKKIKEIIVVPREKLGAVQKFTLIDWKTSVFPNTPSRTRYTMKYKVKRKIGYTIETITLGLEKGKIKIINYNIEKE